ncbi:stalk domain-containing protein [Natranaerobius thermophilus]|uniref:stalk domain-containing protein n=1 Tax=Natranaerobius thermophilus TaxID=375929 RepID=UPI002F3F3662
MFNQTLTTNRIAKIVVLGLFFLCFLLPKVGMTHSSDHELNIYLDQELVEFDVSPIIRDGRTLVPFRKLAESLDVTVDWNSETETITAYSEEKNLVMQIDSDEVILNGHRDTLEVPPQITSGRTLIPLRFFSETFGVQVEYKQGEIRMTSTKPEPDELTIDGTLSAFYAHGYGERSSWEELFGAAYPQKSEDSRVNLFSNIHLGWFEVSDKGHLVTDGKEHGFRRPAGYQDVIENLSQENVHGNLTVFGRQGENGVEQVLLDESKRELLISDIIEELKEDGYSGVNLDIEELGKSQDQEQNEAIKSAYIDFVTEIDEQLSEEKQLILTVPPANSFYRGYDYEQLGDIADKMVVMAYDYHDRNLPSATAPINKVEEGIQQLVELVDSDKIVLGVRLPAVRYREVESSNGDQVEQDSDLVEEEKEREITSKWMISHPYLDSVYDFKEEKGIDKQWDEQSAVNYLSFTDEKGFKKLYIYGK